ncbi:MAG: CHAT domain-containing tetratricopeptide repeat protein [Acidobacteriota bacterium]
MLRPRVLLPALLILYSSPSQVQAAEPPLALFDRALTFHENGRLDEALAAYRVAAPALEKIDPESAGTARNNACAILNDRGDFRGALVECTAAVRLRRLGKDPILLARALNNRGRSLQSLGRTEEAETSFRDALGLNRQGGDAEGEEINLANLGVAATESGRYGRALEAYREAAAVAARHAAEPWAADQIRIARINEGVVLEKLGAYEEALALYRDLLGVQGTGSTGGDLDPRLRASIAANAGVLYRNLGDPRRAIAAFTEAAKLYAQAGDRAGASNVALNLGLARHLNLNDRPGAEVDFRTALKLAQASGDQSEEIQDLFYLGRLLIEEGRLGEAEDAFSRCLKSAVASGSAEGRWSAREGLGRIAAARGDLAKARNQLDQALAEIEATRDEIGAKRLQASYFGDHRSVYETAVAIEARSALAGDGQAAGRALLLVERAKARELVDALGVSSANPESLARSKALNLAALARSGSPAEPVLEYFVAEGNLYLWRLGTADAAGSKIQLFDLGPSAPTLLAVRRVHRELAAGRSPAASDLAALSATLLGQLGELAGISRLRIAPDGELRYLPFELLPLPGTNEPLIGKVAVSYLPSAAVALALAARPASHPSRAFLGFGAPLPPAPASPPAPGVPKTTATSSSPLALLTARFSLHALPGAAREIAEVEPLMTGRPGDPDSSFLGERATEAAFRAQSNRGARVLHFATHTVLDERAGRGAAILLTPSGEDDGLLDPAEIAARPVHADLAVLSACSTALGGDFQRRGAGALSSLSGAFIAAGVSGVVASLWDVGDQATAVFMGQFYAQLARGLPPAEALAATKRRLLATPGWDRPGVWSAFILIGEAPPVVTGGSVRFLRTLGPAGPIAGWCLAALAIAGIAGAAFRSIRRPAPDDAKT